MLATHGLPELAQALGLDLADALARHVKSLPTSSREIGLLAKPNRLRNTSPRRCEVGEHLADCSRAWVDTSSDWGHGLFIIEEIAKLESPSSPKVFRGEMGTMSI
jgi:hypothetical protein